MPLRGKHTGIDSVYFDFKVVLVYAGEYASAGKLGLPVGRLMFTDLPVNLLGLSKGVCYRAHSFIVHAQALSAAGKLTVNRGGCLSQTLDIRGPITDDLG